MSGFARRILRATQVVDIPGGTNLLLSMAFTADFADSSTETGTANVDSDDAYHLSIWPVTSQNPNAGAKYQSLSWGK